MAADAPADDLTQADMVHRLPPARVVDRVAYLAEVAKGRSVAHVGFVDAGCWAFHERLDSWLHAHLDRVASRTTGFDLDEAGVARAREMGFDAHAVDCTDQEAIAALGLDPYEVVIAGEVIEHVDRAGDFLDGLHRLVVPGGRLVVTTPNASGLLNAGAAALVGYEVNHPDHITLYSCFTLVNLLARHGWELVEVATYVPPVKDPSALRGKLRVLATGAQVVGAVERLLGRLGRPYAADGLIVTARPSRPPR
jgi:SAM-dependent methyltransferase